MENDASQLPPFCGANIGWPCNSACCARKKAGQRGSTPLRATLFVTLWICFLLGAFSVFPELSQAEGLASTRPAAETVPENWNVESVDTATGAGYLSGVERELIIEINMVRTDPAGYARAYLTPIRGYYAGRQFAYPGQPVLHTREGVRALDECIRQLLKTRPVQALSPKEGLSRAARDHWQDQAGTGASGHAGSDGSTFGDRMNRYGAWDIAAGENLYYGNWQVRRIVTALLIDDGVSSRGHRKNILNPAFRFIGVAAGPHPVYRQMYVMDFAGAYQ